MKNLDLLRIDILSYTKYPIKDMFRVCKINNEIVIDFDYNLKGRGCYLLKDINSVLLAKKKNALSRGLKMKVDESIYDLLLEKLERM